MQACRKLTLDRDRDPDLRLHGVLAGAIERLDSQVLLDPFEEQFYLPTGLVDLGDGKCRKCEIVSEKLEAFPGFHVEITDAPERVGVHLGGVERGEDNRVVGSNSSALVHRT